MASRIMAGALGLVVLASGVLAVGGGRAAAQTSLEGVAPLPGGWYAGSMVDSNGRPGVCAALRPPNQDGAIVGVFAAPGRGTFPPPFRSDGDVQGVIVKLNSWRVELGDKPRPADVKFDAQGQYHSLSAYVLDQHTLLIPMQGDDMVRQFRKSYAMSITVEGRHFDFSLAGTFRLFPVLANCVLTSSIKGAPGDPPVGPTNLQDPPTPAGQAESDCNVKAAIADPDRGIEACSELLARGMKLSAERRSHYQLYRAVGYIAKDEDDRALADVDAASALDRESYMVFLVRGLVYGRKGRRELAVHNFNAAIARANVSDAHVGLGDVYAASGEFDRALAEYDRASRINPNDAGAYRERALMFLIQGNRERAVTEIDTAIRLDANDPTSLRVRAVIQARTGDPASAIADAQQSVRLRPKAPDNHAALAFVLAKAGDFERAQGEIDEAFRLGSKNANALLYRGEIHLLKHEPELALKDFDGALARSPYSPFAKAGREAALSALSAPVAPAPAAVAPAVVASPAPPAPAPPTPPAAVAVAVPRDATADSSAFYGDEEIDFSVFPQNALQGEVRKPTPLAIPSAVTVTTMELKKAIDAGRPMILIDVLRDEHAETIKGAVALPYAGTSGTFQDPIQPRLATALNNLLQERRDATLVFFCRGVNCWESYNAALRAHAAGFQNIMWYRGGMAAWREAGFGMQPNN